MNSKVSTIVVGSPFASERQQSVGRILLQQYEYARWDFAVARRASVNLIPPFCVALLGLIEGSSGPREENCLDEK